MNNRLLIEDFLRESNEIESIYREVDTTEIKMASQFLKLSEIKIADLCNAVSVFQCASNLPVALLRMKIGEDVRVGNYFPPKGGPEIRAELTTVLNEAMDLEEYTPYRTHLKYEELHPFMDCNGRSGRLLWAWQMVQNHGYKGLVLKFLHQFYYQSLEAGR